MIIGFIDLFQENKILGWLGSFTSQVTPFITANGKPCRIIATHTSRPDVSDATGLEPNVGFIAKVPHQASKNIEFKLYAIDRQGTTTLVDTKTFAGGCIDPKRLCSVFDALEIAKQKDSVGIVCWEGTHNPIGRALAMQNILRNNRSSVIVAFDMGFSELGIWPPLINSDLKVLIIPWIERDAYFSLFSEIGLSFDTIWICKPCYPSFELAKHLCNTRTRFIQDIDDNEYEFSKAEDAKLTPYGLVSNLMAQRILAKIPQRSCASISLQDAFGGQIVRHARSKRQVQRQRQTDLRQPVRVGFFGTVRPHKGVVEAARIIRFLNRSRGLKIQFVVGGMFEPLSLREQLISLDCEIQDRVDFNNLSSHIEALDVVIAGFNDANTNFEITNYQISSKIGDALSNARPVLVPLGPSVRDLDTVPGVYLFNTESFVEKLLAAITFNKKIDFPSSFDLNTNYKAFTQLELEARTNGPSANEIFENPYTTSLNVDLIQSTPRKKAVLVWKQHDAALYGRRIDQVARGLLDQVEIEDVIVLELITSEQLREYESNAYRVDSDKQFIYGDSIKKLSSICAEGVTYKSLLIEDENDFSTLFNRYLIDNRIYPTNSTFILFPAIGNFDALLSQLDGYPIIGDLVDNQMSWQSDNPFPLLTQYAAINCAANQLVFNSEINRDFFVGSGLSFGKSTHLIPNWYTLPKSFNQIIELGIDIGRNIVYSGNMNDRIDWQLIRKLHDSLDSETRIHLVGNAERALEEITALLENCPNLIYHGPLRETALLKLLKRSQLAIMPHTHDSHSMYMNPMKAMMYQKIGIRCITTDIPGIEADGDRLIVCGSHTEFISTVRKFLTIPLANPLTADQRHIKLSREYVQLIFR